jgi:hypothetical protein
VFPQNEIGPSISSSVVLCPFVLLVYIVTLVLVFYLCPSSLRVVATFPGSLISFTIFCAPFFLFHKILIRHTLEDGNLGATEGLFTDNCNCLMHKLLTILYSYNKSQQDALFLNFILIKNSTCFGQIYCPSSGVATLYTQQ